MAIQPMRHAPLLLDARPRRDDAQVAIDLHRIGVDDDAAEFFRQRHRQRRFATGGWAGDEDALGVAHGLDVIHLSAN
jgi:hypothetical protein